MKVGIQSPRTEALICGVVYFCLASTAISLTRFEGGVAFVSIANAFLFARLLTLAVRDWASPLMACALAGGIATALLGLGPQAAIPLIVVNIGEVTLGAWLLQRAVARKGGDGSKAPLVMFLTVAGLLTPAVGASGAAMVATAFGGDTYLNNWLNWFAGHALGAVAFTPLCVYILRGDARSWLATARRREIIEALFLVALVATVSICVFAQDAMPLLFLPMLPITLATFRTGTLGAAASIALLTLVAGWLTISGHGPIALMSAPLGGKVHFLQFYLACTVAATLPVAAELTRRTALYRRLHDSEARYRLLTEQSTDIVLNLDLDGRIRFASPAIRQIGGYDPLDVVGRSATELVHHDDIGSVTEAHRKALRDPGQTVIVEYRALTSTGEVRWFETHTRAVTDENGRISGMVCAVRDVMHRKAVEHRLSEAALTDRLTGIANRRAFDGQLNAVLAPEPAGQSGCVALLDLDHFKLVNDRFGHAAGDAVLKSFATVVRSRLRDRDFIARVGGEEFACILPGTSADQARLVCDRIREAVSESSVEADGTPITVTVSVGVARYEPGTTADGVLAAADTALYAAKRSGRNRMKMAA